MTYYDHGWHSTSVAGGLPLIKSRHGTAASTAQGHAGGWRYRPVPWCCWILAAYLGGCLADADGTVQDDFQAQRLELRHDRALVSDRLLRGLPDRVKRLTSAIDALLAVATVHRAEHQVEALGQLIAGLRLLDPHQSKSRGAALAALPPMPAQIAPLDQRLWDSALQSKRSAALQSTRTLIEEAIRCGLADVAGDLLRQYLVAFPDDPVVHRSLGQTRLRNHWYGPNSLVTAQGGLDWDDQLGWVRHADHDRYARGEYCDLDTGIWSSMDAADARHATLENGWVIQSEHLEVHGNAHLADMVRCINHLELFYQQIFSVYALFFCPKEQSDLRLVFAMANSPRLIINLERNREDYQRALPVPAGWSAGMFVSGRIPASYFYISSDEVMYHEFTHQILGVFAHDNQAPMWLVEGVAVYSQSPVFQDGELELGHIGGNSHIQEYLRECAVGTAVGLDHLLGLVSSDSWTGSSDPVRNYAAAGAFLEFLMESQRRRYRADLIDFLRDSYVGDAGGHSLFEYLGITKEALQAQYVRWIAGVHVGVELGADPIMDSSAAAPAEAAASSADGSDEHHLGLFPRE